MSETVHCIFIPTKFLMSDVISIVLYFENQPENLPILSIIVKEKKYQLRSPSISNGKISWEINSLCDFYEEAPECHQFSLLNGAQREDFSLDQLVFLGPSKTATPPPNIFLVEFISGVYARSQDYHEDTVSFKVDSLLTLDSRNVASIQSNLAMLSDENSKFEEKKRQLASTGIDLERLSELKTQYEEKMKEKRRIQYQFEQQNQQNQAESIHEQNEKEVQASVERLKKHIQENREKQQQVKSTLPDPASYQKLLQFRIAALNELALIFDYQPTEKRLCTVYYIDSPKTPSEFNSRRAFLGFATHYIREISRIVGMPLSYNLIPRASSSQIVCRLTDKKWTIPTENHLNEFQEYETLLLNCAKHIIKPFQMSSHEPETFIESIGLLTQIGPQDLAKLNPSQNL